MGGTSSKNGLVKSDDNPKDYKTQDRLFYKRWEIDEEGWYVDLRREQDEINQKEVTRIIIRRPMVYDYRIEVAYQFRFVHKYQLKRPIVKRGIRTFQKRERQIDFIGFEEPLNTYYRVNFQAFVYALIDAKGIRQFNFCPNLFGKSKLIRWIDVPVESLSRRTPLLAAHFETNETDEIEDKLLGVMPLILQIIYGVHIHIERKYIEPILDLAVEYKLHYVKKYCEQQVIRRFDFEFPLLKKYEMACKYDLDLLMSQVLVGLNSRRKLKKFAIKAIGIDKMNGKIMKLIAGKIFELS